jgi:hypothetical protein
MAERIRDHREGEWIEIDWKLTDSFEHICFLGIRDFTYPYMRRRWKRNTELHQVWGSLDGDLWCLLREEE